MNKSPQARVGVSFADKERCGRETGSHATSLPCLKEISQNPTEKLFFLPTETQKTTIHDSVHKCDKS